MKTFLASLLLIAAIPAYGSMIVVSGVTMIAPPPSLLAGQLVSDGTIYGFSEQQGVTLASNISAGITTPGTWICCSGFTSAGIIPAGETLNSYLLYASPQTDQEGQFFREYTGQITFSAGEKVVGIIIGAKYISATDAMLGAAGTTYPPGSYQLGGLEPNDEVVLSNNMQSIFVKFNVEVGGEDIVRVLTATPEPAEFLLIGSGLTVLALIRRRVGSKKRG